MTTTMSASEALDYALNWAEGLGPEPLLVLIYVADSGTLDTDHLAHRTGMAPARIRECIAHLSSQGHLERIKGRWAA